MKMNLKLLAIFFLIFVANCQDGQESNEMPPSDVDFKQEDGVLILTDQDHDAAIQNFRYLLVEYYAPWCGHCKQLEPEYKKAAATLEQAQSDVRLAKVDATEQKQVAEQVQIEGYPTLKFYIEGEPIDFGGDRTAEGIVDWINKKLGPSSNQVDTTEESEKLIADNEVVVFYFGKESDEDFQKYLGVSSKLDDVLFVHSFSDDVKAFHKVAADVKVVLFKKFDTGRNDYTGAVTSEDLTSFINKNQWPPVMLFDQRSAERIFSGLNNCLFLFVKQDDPASEAAKENFQKVAQSMTQGENQIYFAYADVADELGERLSEYLGVTANDAPCVRLGQPTEEDIFKFIYSGEINEAGVTQFLDDFKSGKLEPFYKTQEIPEKQEGPVTVLVGKNFDDIVLDQTKDVLVEFYAPWCGHCKSLEPIYNTLAEKLSSNSNIVIAKIDATENEVKGAAVQGFPTIKFYPSNNKAEPIDFDGDRTEEGILEFLKSYTTFDWVEAAKKEEL